MTKQPEELSERELHQLLPFYVNGSLEGEELDAIKAYLAGSEEARQEVAFLEQLRENIKKQPQVNSPGELGLKRLQREISRNETLRSGKGEQASDLARKVQLSARAGVSVWWRNLAVAACLTLVVLGAFSRDVWLGDGGDMHLAGSENTAHIQVTFKPQATEEAIRLLLLETGLTIKEGPSTLGVYRLDAETNAGDETLDGILQRLRSRKDVVETADLE
jgi:hypothetical protein